MTRKKQKPRNSRVKVPDLFGLAEADIQAIDGHPAASSASNQVRKTIEAITGWRIRKQGGIPKAQFKLAADFEDALGQLKEAYVGALREWLLSQTCPLCGSRPKRTTPPTR